MVALSAGGVETLRNHRRAVADVYGIARVSGSSYVFAAEDGAAWVPHKVTDGFRDLAKKAKIASISFHSLRHTCASLLLAEGVHPKVVQEMLGHSTVAITMDLYSHSTPSLQTDAVQRLDGILRLKLRS